MAAGDWTRGRGLAVAKHRGSRRWRAHVERVGCVTETDTADQAKAALEAWVDSLGVP